VLIFFSSTLVGAPSSVPRKRRPSNDTPCRPAHRSVILIAAPFDDGFAAEGTHWRPPRKFSKSKPAHGSAAATPACPEAKSDDPSDSPLPGHRQERPAFNPLLDEADAFAGLALVAHLRADAFEPRERNSSRASPIVCVSGFCT